METLRLRDGMYLGQVTCSGSGESISIPHPKTSPVHILWGAGPQVTPEETCSGQISPWLGGVGVGALECTVARVTIIFQSSGPSNLCFLIWGLGKWRVR